MPPTCFLVMGPPRSGTSAVAGVLHALGVRMGVEIEPGRHDFPDPTPMNPKGFFQDAPLENLQDLWFGGTFPAADYRLPAAPGLAEAVTVRAAPGGDWGSKTSRVQWAYEAFVAACPCPVKVIRTNRKPARSVASWAAHMGPADARGIIDRCLARLASVPTDLTVDYDALHDDTTATVARIAAFVGRPVTAAALSHIDPSLRRF